MPTPNPHPLHQSLVRPSSPGASSLSSESAARRIAANAVEAPTCPIAWGTWLRKYQLGSWCEKVAPQQSSATSSATSSACAPNGTTTYHSPNPTTTHTPDLHLPEPASSSYATTPPPPTQHARTTSAKLCQPFESSKAHRYVKLDSEQKIESMQFYKKNGWLAAPPLPRRQHRRVAEALRRHALTGAQDRDALNLYVQHAKAVFKCDYASFMVESPDETYMLILAQDGGNPQVQIVPRTVTLCSHAMLLSDDEVLVIANTQNDWRFRACPSTLAGTVTNAKGNPMSFYASAPLFLSYSLYGIEGRVQVGRLCIMDQQPRENFDEKDAELLYSIGKMAGDALEKEYQSARNAKAAEMQQRTSSLIRSLEDASLTHHHRHLNASTNSISNDSEHGGYARYSLVVIDRACHELQQCLGAAAVAAFDINNFRFRRAPQQSVSPRNSTAFAAATVPLWHHFDDKDLTEPVTPPADSVSTPTLIDPDSPMISPRMSRNLSSSADPVGVLQAIDLREGSPPPSLLSFSGPDDYRPNLPDDIDQLKAVFASPLARMAAETKMNLRCKFYRRPVDGSSSSDDGEDDDTLASGADDNDKDPWQDLLPTHSHVSSYAVVACYNRAKLRPGIMFLIMFADHVCFDQQERFFVESTMQIALGSLLRQKLSEVDFFQAEFLRHVQHNLRTPLHGALGAVEYLRAAISNDPDDDAVKIDLSADGVLATLLESISLSGLTLNSYIDDLLSFQNLSGIKGGLAPAVKRTSTDIVKVIEAVADEEWEFAQRLDHQSRKLDEDDLHPDAVASNAVELIIKATPEVRECDWIVDVKSLQDVVRKVVSNAVRFTQKGYVEVSIRLAEQGALDEVETEVADGYAVIEIEVADTGVGMTKDFCQTQLTRPFTKGDSFRDGIGLGMTIVSSTLQKFGGKLSVASEVNVGTRVTMCVPLQRSPSHGRSGSTSTNVPTRFAASKLAYYGLDTRGLRRLANSICEYFMPMGGIELTRNFAEADCVVLPMRAVGKLAEGEPSLLSQVKPDARFVVITSSHTVHDKDVEMLDGRAMLPLPMPHGPSALRLMETFLTEEVPMHIHIADARNGLHRGSVSEQGSVNGLRKVSGHRTSGSDASRKANEAQVSSSVEDTDAKSLPKIITNTTLRDDEFRVLVVEDNPINMRLLTTLCKRLDIRYEEAHDGAEAVTKFISFRPSVVLLDISLPIQDGFEACAQMRTHDVPSYIVAVTALSSEEDKTRGIESCGMDAWMTKPVSPRQLKNDLEKWKVRFEQSWATNQAENTLRYS
ncbi:two-component sensor histidine kinase/response regulator hybrid protein [Moesziomyces antarcticus]|uniref:Related to SLN1 - histidine kinase osmosensor that regulates a MAP kinase cascade n=2 Tax=Pseudozyma antarctica TaxID=84753 RepID=A0A5C3FU63_PSEA2|nr:two-component sensor histidine kinase/response regulator hybrid protein [Moesziomyces antarcticus]GAK66661.1 two-component sensor histidine kinase/response regulator hybrid protein [Moesziomyces antarcticus]SPO47710.1 related to SLN1 - histidine kinase osmosensor that regulates a MAP kinase cascade [Moesziomyces antarcticus]